MIINNKTEKEIPKEAKDQGKDEGDFAFKAPENLYKLWSTEGKTVGEFNINIEEMARAGLHFGHQTSRRHPKMSPYIYGVRNTIHIINLEKVAEKLEEALKFIRDFVSENKTLLFVGTKPQVRELVKGIAKDCNFPYVENRWVGGTFTNFETIRKRIDRLKELESKRGTGELEKYTKKEKAKINKNIGNMEAKFGGIKELTRLPDAVFIVDMKNGAITVREAKARGVKIIAICDTNTDPTLADYPIPANDDSFSSVQYVLGKVREVALSAKAKQPPELKPEA